MIRQSFFVFRSLMIALVYLMLVGCYSQQPLDPVTEQDIMVLHNRVLDTELVDAWNALDLVVGLSPQSLRAISTLQDLSILSPELAARVSQIQSLGISLKTNGIVVLLKPSAPKMKKSEILQPEIEAFLENKRQEIRESKKVHAWETLTNSRMLKLYCIDQCACLSREFMSVLPQDKAVSLTIYNKGDVKIKNSYGVTSNYQYHVATAILLESGEWGIIDPIMYGNTKLYSLSHWYSNILETSNLEIHISVR